MHETLKGQRLGGDFGGHKSNQESRVVIIKKGRSGKAEVVADEGAEEYPGGRKWKN